MRISILGSSGYPRRLSDRSSCILLPDHGVLLDAGAGLALLPDHPAYRSTKEFITLLSHFHVDHLVGLFYLLPHIVPDGKTFEVRGDERLPKLAQLFAEPFFSSVEGTTNPIRANLLSPTFTLNGLTVTVQRFPHDTGWTNGFRLTDGQSIVVYITDTTADSANAAFAAGADLLLHECNYPNRLAAQAKQEGHSYSDAVATYAKAAGVKRLVLIHLEKRFREDVMREVQATFPNAEAGTNGLELTM